MTKRSLLHRHAVLRKCTIKVLTVNKIMMKLTSQLLKKHSSTLSLCSLLFSEGLTKYLLVFFKNQSPQPPTLFPQLPFSFVLVQLDPMNPSPNSTFFFKFMDSFFLFSRALKLLPSLRFCPSFWI